MLILNELPIFRKEKLTIVKNKRNLFKWRHLLIKYSTYEKAYFRVFLCVSSIFYFL